MIDNFSKRKHGNQLLDILCHASSYETADALMQKLSISRRALFYLINKVNTELDECSEFPITNVKNMGYFLPKETINFLTQFDDTQPSHIASNSADERRHLMILSILDSDGRSLVQLLNQFNVSKNTVIHDIEIIKNMLEPYSLKIKNTPAGKIMLGHQIDIRKWVYDHTKYLNIITPHENSKISKSVIENQITLFERITGKYLTDNARTNLSIFLFWYLNRSQKPINQLNNESKTINKLSLDFTWATSFLNDCHISNPDEAYYLVKLINSSQFSHVNWDDPLISKLKPVAVRMITDFNHLSGSRVTPNSISDSLAVHLLSTYYRVIYSMPYEYPDLKSIKNDYPQTFEITKKVSSHFENLIHSKLSDDEISLIAIYFGGAIRDQKLSEPVHKEVLVVCSSGIGTSRLLLKQLETRYRTIQFSAPMNILQYENASLSSVKLIISTITLKRRNEIPIVTVSAFPSALEWKIIDDSLAQSGLIQPQEADLFDVNTLLEIVENYAKITDISGLKSAFLNYLTKITQTPLLRAVPSKLPEFYSLLPANHVGFLSHQESWQQAVRSALAPLVEDYSVEKSYVDKIISLTEKNGPYMVIGENIMLAHAAPRDGVNTLGASLFLLDQPLTVISENKTVRLIIGLAPVDSNQHLKFLSDLMTYLQDDAWLQQLLVNRSRDSLLNFINITSIQN